MRTGVGNLKLLPNLKVISFNYSIASPVVEFSFFWTPNSRGAGDIEQCDLSIDPLVCSFHCCDFFSLESGREGQLWEFAAIKMTTIFGSSEPFHTHFHKFYSILSQS